MSSQLITCCRCVLFVLVVGICSPVLSEPVDGGSSHKLKLRYAKFDPLTRFHRGGRQIQTLGGQLPASTSRSIYELHQEDLVTQ